jgi:hypothetical protein
MFGVPFMSGVSNMSSRLFKNKMAMTNRPPVMPHLVTSLGDVYGYDSKTDVFQRITQSLFTVNEVSVNYSPDGRYLVSSSNTSTASTNSIFKRTSVGYTKLTLPISNPSGWCEAAFSPDSKDVYIASNAANGGLYHFRINADDSITQMPNWTGMSIYTQHIAATADGKYVAVSFSQGVYLMIFKIVNGVATKLTTTSPGYTSGRMVWIDHTLVYISGSSNGAFTYTVDDADIVTRAATVGIDFYYSYSTAASKDGVYFINGCLYGIDLYKFDKTTLRFTKLARYSPGGNNMRITGVRFSDDNQYVVSVGQSAVAGGPQLFVHRRNGDILTPISIPAANLPGSGMLQDVSVATPVYI